MSENTDQIVRRSSTIPSASLRPAVDLLGFPVPCHTTSEHVPGERQSVSRVTVMPEAEVRQVVVGFHDGLSLAERSRLAWLLLASTRVDGEYDDCSIMDLFSKCFKGDKIAWNTYILQDGSVYCGSHLNPITFPDRTAWERAISGCK